MHCKIGRIKKFFFGYLLELWLIYWFHKSQRVKLIGICGCVLAQNTCFQYHILSIQISVASNGFLVLLEIS